jgi:hypothetical protein
MLATIDSLAAALVLPLITNRRGEQTVKTFFRFQ